MGRLFLITLEVEGNIHRCRHCLTHFAAFRDSMHDQMLGGRAFLFPKVNLGTLSVIDVEGASSINRVGRKISLPKLRNSTCCSSPHMCRTGVVLFRCLSGYKIGGPDGSGIIELV
ncbi:hypothetical protein L484_015574 [Morus notabilis]|uniref:Uncharacterized protein n=1 Tax=Morus notabilis TaxID=981085 RepID=W9SAW8_9ROSA|nr:hypothetical protein L484_015574 [Morus notabilis]